MPNRTTRLSISSAVRLLADTLLVKADRWYPHKEEAAARNELYANWQSQLQKAVLLLGPIARRSSPPNRREISEVLEVLDRYMKKVSLGDEALLGAWSKGKDEVAAKFRRAGGKKPAKKADVGFGMLFGLTEQHALKALQDFLRLSAGGFWDDEMSDVVRNELESWFEGEQGINRSTFAERLKKLVNDRLSIEGKNSLPRSYFDGLAEQTIVRTRSVANVYKGKELGAIGYRLRNPRDARTSPICRELADGSTIYPFAGAEKEVETILTASSLADLKAKVPFRSSASSAGAKTPPLHWRCRTAMEMVFEGLND